MDLSHQIICASKLLYMFATELSQLDEGKNVDIISVGGNHNRLTKKECNIEGDNVNVIIVENLKTFNELTKNNRINILDVEDKDDMLNEVCDLIDEHDLANMRELRRFVRNHGTEYNLPSMKVINSVLRSHTGLLRLYFDAVYQERRYGRSDYDKETGEIKG